MVIPASVYVMLIPAGDWAHGWGVPMSTDTAFAVAMIAMMGRSVPIELRIFLSAATIIDDIGAITVVALFYSAKVDVGYLAAAAGCVASLGLLRGVGQRGTRRNPTSPPAGLGGRGPSQADMPRAACSSPARPRLPVGTELPRCGNAVFRRWVAPSESTGLRATQAAPFLSEPGPRSSPHRYRRGLDIPA